MRSRQHNSQADGHIPPTSEQDVSVRNTVPDFTRTWESLPQVASAIRRPSTFPDPSSYHEAIEHESIFELDERQKDGSIETILVTPFGCERCRGLKQACSRARPACQRCRRAGVTCNGLQGGYQRLPGPKFTKPPTKGKQGTTRTVSNTLSRASSLQSRRPPAGRLLRDRRIIRRAVSLSQVDPRSSPAPGSKRSLSPDSDPAPPRKKKTQTHTRTRKARCEAVEASQEPINEHAETLVVDPSAQVTSALGSSGERSALEWTFVKKTRVRGRKSCQGQDSSHSVPATIPTSTRMPRVWTNSLYGLSTVSLELTKSPAGFSWLQSGTPILLLGTNGDQGHWINPTTLAIDLSWDFSCCDLELEPIVESNAGGSPQHHPCPPVFHPPESSRHPHHPIQTEVLPTDEAMSTPLPTSGAPTTPTDYTIPLEPFRCQAAHSELHASAAPNKPASADCLSQRHPIGPPLFVASPPSHPFSQHESSIPQSKPRADFQPPIPISKPPEVETLSNSRRCSIPLLLWMPHDSRLLPSSLPPEYAYACMGFFFISDLRHTVIQHDASSTMGVVKGRVCWSVTLYWAPGGEDALFENQQTPSSDTMDSTPSDHTRDLQRPWWLDPADPLPQENDAIPYAPNDSRTQFSSFIPLELLADFRPSEAFPLGWFCKSCGMINTQQFFRHQICQSIMCQSAQEEPIPRGKVEPLSSLRGFYQSSALIQPMNHVPSTIDPHCVSWDDGMQCWIYDVRDGVSLCHIFTGNQGQLQEDATALLMGIQRDVLLRKEDPSGPYFTHTTRVSHPNDGSEARVPGGTPDCVRTAYHTLCDFVFRYGEMERPLFGEIRMQAWVTTGSKKGGALRATKFPVVIHCLGAEVVLKLTPSGGYQGCADSTVPDKGEESAHDQDLREPPAIEPHAGPSRHQDLPNFDQTSFNMSRAEPIGLPIIAETAHEAAATLDTICQPSSNSFDADGIAISSSNVPHFGLGMEANHHELIEPKEISVHKGNKVTKGKKKASAPEISMTLVHGDCFILSGDDFECQIVRTGTTILVMGFPEEI